MPRRETNVCYEARSDQRRIIVRMNQAKVHLEILGRRYPKYKLAFVVGD